MTSSSSSSSSKSSSSQQPQQRFSDHQKHLLKHYGIDEFSCGCLGGVGKVLAGHPFDTVKGRVQTGLYGPSPLDALKGTIKNEGVRGLYRGLVPPCLAVGFVSGTLFFVNGRVRKFIQPDYPHNKEPLTYSQMLFAAGCGGCAVGCVVTPFEVLKVNRQISSSNSSVVTSSSSVAAAPTTVKGIIQQQNGFGARGLYCGFVATLMRESGTFGFFFPLNEFLRAQVLQRYVVNNNTSYNENPATMTLPIHLRVICAGVSGIICWIPFYPIDQIKTRIQTQSFTDVAAFSASSISKSGSEINNSNNKNKPKMITMSQAFRQLLQEGGVKRLYRGLTPCLVRAFPAYAAQYTTFEAALHWVRS